MEDASAGANPTLMERAGQAVANAARGLAVDTGACELFLQTARDNEVAQKLYRRLGYVRDDDFFVYSLNLSR